MNRTAEIVSKQVLRGVVLRIASDADPLGAGVEVIHAAVKRYGYKAERSEVEAVCQYLEGKGLVRIQRLGNAILKINRDIAHILPKGIDVLEGTEAIEGIELVE